MNEKLEAFNQEIEKTEKKLRRAQHEEKIAKDLLMSEEEVEEILGKTTGSQQ